MTTGTVIEPSSPTSYVVSEIVIGPGVGTVRPYDGVVSSVTFTVSPSASSSRPLTTIDVGPLLPPAMIFTSSRASLTDAAPSSGLSFDGGTVVTIWPSMSAYQV